MSVFFALGGRIFVCLPRSSLVRRHSSRFAHERRLYSSRNFQSIFLKVNLSRKCVYLAICFGTFVCFWQTHFYSFVFPADRSKASGCLRLFVFLVDIIAVVFQVTVFFIILGTHYISSGKTGALTRGITRFYRLSVYLMHLCFSIRGSIHPSVGPTVSKCYCCQHVNRHVYTCFNS